MEIKPSKIDSMRPIRLDKHFFSAIFSKKIMFKQTIKYMIKLPILQTNSKSFLCEKCAIKDCKFGVNLHSFVSHSFFSHSFIALTLERFGKGQFDSPCDFSKTFFSREGLKCWFFVTFNSI